MELVQLVEACFPPDALAHGGLDLLVAFSSFPDSMSRDPGRGPAGDCWTGMATVMNGGSATAADWQR
ncbi:unnamed protein product [Triticum turgidum subsp. durum]|uniref:Uncharacterized protein n=1 Tax=Triticum turgidum subsp. durum TaxID=4567 RepID=A0A9R1PH40_TRITD|nr:unnamed protein product [Triticum turgidum subsp. durum]